MNYTKLLSGYIETKIKAKPLEPPRFNFSMISFCGTHIIVSGGSDKDLSQLVEIYEIKIDLWSSGPKLVKKRNYQSSCIHGNRWMYTIGGYKQRDGQRGCVRDRGIERLDVRATLRKSAAMAT